MAQPTAQGFGGEASTSNAQANPVVPDDSSQWRIKPKTVDSWDTPSGQSHLFYLTENQAQEPHEVHETGRVTSIATQDIAKWVAENSPRSSIEDNGAAYEALVGVYGVLMETSEVFREHMIKRAKEKEGRPEAIDVLHEYWVQGQNDQTSGHVVRTEATHKQSDTIHSKLPSVKSEATVDAEDANAKGKAKLKELGEQIKATVRAINSNQNQAGSESQGSRDGTKPFVALTTDTAATDDVVYLFSTRKPGQAQNSRDENSNVLSAKGEGPSARKGDHSGLDKNEHSSSHIDDSPTSVSYNAVNHKQLTLVGVSKSAKDALKAKGFRVLEIQDGAAAQEAIKLSPKSPAIIVTGHGNIINVTCPSTTDSLPSPTSDIVETTIAIKSSDKEVSPKDVSLPSSVPTHGSDKSIGPHSGKAVNRNPTCVSLSSNHSSNSSLRTLRRVTEYENLSAAANTAPLAYSTASPCQGEASTSHGETRSVARGNIPIPQLPAHSRNVSPSKLQAVGNTDPVKRRSTRAPPPPPINTASGFLQSGIQPGSFSPEYPLSSNPSLIQSPRTPNDEAYPALLARSQGSLTRTPLPTVVPTNPLASTNNNNNTTNQHQPVLSEAGLAAAIADGAPIVTDPGRYLEDLSTRVHNLEIDNARAVAKVLDDQNKIESLEEEVEGLKERLTWYEAEWRRLARVHVQDGGHVGVHVARSAHPAHAGHGVRQSVDSNWDAATL